MISYMSRISSKDTILFISDNPLSTSGVATQARYLINGLLSTGKYRFMCLGGSLRNPSHEPMVVNEDFIIKPIDGFGTKELIRAAIIETNPSAIILFTDPRFFIHIWEMEDEIRQVCPLAYWHLWDNGPWPEFNRVLYESTDLLNCINYPTYEMLSREFPHKTNYIPHAVPKEIFSKMSKEESRSKKAKVLGQHNVDKFVLLYVGRNAYRKMTPDLLHSWAIFIAGLKNDGITDLPLLLMHTDPFDPEGGNLNHVIELLNITDSVMFSSNILEFNDMKSIYNISDVLINISKAEGFGLPVLEAKMCGKPVIAIKTGGLTRQVVDHETGIEFGVAIEPTINSLVGTQTVPYIFESLVHPAVVAEAIRKMYDMSPEAREILGDAAMEHAHKNYDLQQVVNDWDVSLGGLIKAWKNKALPANKRYSLTQCDAPIRGK